MVQRGKADGCFINTTGIGMIEGDVELGAAKVRPGDAMLVSGPIGDHGIAIMLARGELDLVSDVRSDTALAATGWWIAARRGAGRSAACATPRAAAWARC